eukprot:TRINITY_DN1722_c0_g1_i1.p1 TRINITY_DN1722_c0_g1~~TRINITY_DN1722_c0_g1_i1.p1  ORF type:complete len:345 (+),score=90.46 TRINITY_DN1722_c0_g1_i1:47-1081(+)
MNKIQLFQYLLNKYEQFRLDITIERFLSTLSKEELKEIEPYFNIDTENVLVLKIYCKYCSNVETKEAIENRIDSIIILIKQLQIEYRREQDQMLFSFDTLGQLVQSFSRRFFDFGQYLLAFQMLSRSIYMLESVDGSLGPTNHIIDMIKVISLSFEELTSEHEIKSLELLCLQSLGLDKSESSDNLLENCIHLCLCINWYRIQDFKRAFEHLEEFNTKAVKTLNYPLKDTLCMAFLICFKVSKIPSRGIVSEKHQFEDGLIDHSFFVETLETLQLNSTLKWLFNENVIFSSLNINNIFNVEKLLIEAEFSKLKSTFISISKESLNLLEKKQKFSSPKLSKHKCI